MKKYLIVLFCIVALQVKSVDDKLPVWNTIERIIGERANEFSCFIIPLENNQEIFEISSLDGKICLKGSSQTAIGYAFNWYLRYYCHNQISRAGVNIFLPDTLPLVANPVRKPANFPYRYYLNYCTFNYTMSFWEWDRWEKELDWMAINGINMPLAIIGTEAVWQRTLRKFHFTEKEIFDFIPGPAYKAWWLMGNLEGWAGPVSQQWIDNQVVLQKKILKRMKELDMTPVYQGFYGMVPDVMRKKFPNNKIYDGGLWAGDKRGFHRPAFLDPSDPLFEKMAAVFYDEQQKLFGETKFYGGDPFHEGAAVEGINITQSASKIHNALLQKHPDAIWVLQGWWENPKQELLEGTVKEQVLILDLFAESKPQWEARKGYDGRKWAWCTLLNFGSKSGNFGKLDTFAIEPIRALKSPYGKNATAIGTMMEGNETNPVNYELIYEMAWNSESPFIPEWLKGFTKARYGVENPIANDAWSKIYKTAYNCPTKQEGPSESIFCARGDLNVTGAFRYGTIGIYYDPAVFVQGVRQLASCYPDLKHLDTYQYDLVDFTRQSLADYAQVVYRRAITAYQEKDNEELIRQSDYFLKLIGLQDSVVSMRKEFLLGRWLEDAKAIAPSESEKELFEHNARTLITVWGDEGVAEELHDYSNREWSGMLSDFYHPRWKLFFESLKSAIQTGEYKQVDFYAFEKSWSQERKNYPVVPNPMNINLINQILGLITY